MADAAVDVPALVGAMLTGRSRRRLRRGTVVYREGDRPDEVWFVHEGLVRLVTTGANGVSALVGFRGAGELLGEHPVFDGAPRMATAVVAVDAVMTTIEHGEFRDSVRRDPDVAIWLLSTFAGELRASVGHVLELAAADPTALVARRLTELVGHARFRPLRTSDGRSCSIRMPISHDELARWAGVSRRSTATALRTLRADGTISTGRMRLDVYDAEALERWAWRDRIEPVAVDPGA